MNVFDAILIADWSARSRPSPVEDSPDAIWIAEATRATGATSTAYHRTRAAAEAALVARIGQAVAAGERLLLGFDFAFGYPAGFAQRLSGHAHAFAVWDWLAREIGDGSDNTNNRYAIADRINATFPGIGPFWGRPEGHPLPNLPFRDERTEHGMASHRKTELAAEGRPQSPFKLAGAGAVGSQSLVGLPMLARLRWRFEGRLGAWPFEDHALDRQIVLAEVYPSLIPVIVRTDEVRDEVQVRRLAGALARLGRDRQLDALFSAAAGDRLHEEGWILGVGAEPLLRAAAEEEAMRDADQPENAGSGERAREVVEAEGDAAAEVRPEAERLERERLEGEGPAQAARADGEPERRRAGEVPAGSATNRAGSDSPAGESEPERQAAAALGDDCFALPAGMTWTPVDGALARLRAAIGPVTGAESVDVAEADGRVLAQDVKAARSNPPAANAAVDGYGFAHPGAERPLRLPLLSGRAAAGAPFAGRVPEGVALRVLTGALLPEGVDTVVLQEEVALGDGHVALGRPPKRGANTRAAGEDMQAGVRVLAAGRRLGPADLALLTAVGVTRVSVRRRLAVGVLSTGDEVVPAGGAAGPAQVFDANRPMLLAMLRRWGHAAVDLGHVGDDRARLARRLDAGAAELGAILTTGGASAGDEDHISALLGEAGVLRTWRVAMKPGRPLALGLWGGIPVFGLPGNPVAAFVTTLIFARPALAVLAGADWPEPAGFTVPAAFAKRKKAGRREYLRARLTPEGAAEAFRSEGSGRISGLSWATGLVELPDEAAEIAPGDPVRFLPYGSFGL